MGWLLNLGMLGKGTPSYGESITAHSLNGTMGRPYAFSPKSAAGTSPSPWYYFRLLTGAFQ